MCNENDGSQEADEIMDKEKYAGRTCQLPNFAVVYSFLSLFGAMLDLPPVLLKDLEQSFDTIRKNSVLIKVRPLS